MKNLTIFIAFCASCLIASAQQNAINENKVTYKWADEFNYTGSNYCNYLNRYGGPSIPYTWWFYRYNISNLDGYNDPTSYKTDCSFLDMTTGDLNLRVEKGPFTETWLQDENGTPFSPPLNVTRQYAGNWITTFPTLDEYRDMDYGLYELRFKIPNAANARNEGIGFAAGLYASDADHCHVEIDIFEMSGLNNHFTHNFLYGGGAPGDCRPSIGPDGNTTNGTLPTHDGLNFINFNQIERDFRCSPERYAGFYKKDHYLYPDDADGYTTMTVEVTPQKITWYMNGKTLQSTTGDLYHTSALQNLPTMEFGLTVKPNDDHDPRKNGQGRTMPTANTVFPFIANIDYFRFQKFKYNPMSMSESLSSSFRYPNQDIAEFVYQDISIGDDGSGGARIINGEVISLRAVDFIELLPGFEVELGGELYADVHECDK